MTVNKNTKTTVILVPAGLAFSRIKNMDEYLPTRHVIEYPFSCGVENSVETPICKLRVGTV